MQCPECKRTNDENATSCYGCNNPLPKAEYTLDDKKPYVIHAEGKLPIVEVELKGRNGLRVLWDDASYNATVEVKHGDSGEWVPLHGVQTIDIHLSCEDPLPRIKINQLIVPGIQGRKISSLIIDEPKDGADNPSEE
jgi:hypothetical protein